MQTHFNIDDERLEYLVSQPPRPITHARMPEAFPGILLKEKDGLGFGFVYYVRSGNEGHGKEAQALSVGWINSKWEEKRYGRPRAAEYKKDELPEP
jgi:hypothetical protein